MVSEIFSNAFYQHFQQVAERLFSTVLDDLQRFQNINATLFNAVDEHWQEDQRGVLVTNRLLNDPKSCWLDIFSD